MPRDLSSFFYPESIAVIGASRSKEKIGSIVLRNIIKSGFEGKVYPINPRVDRIGKLKYFKDVSSLPETPELAVLAVPALLVSEILNQCGKKNIKNVVVLAAGFKELGSEGKKQEEELISLAEKFEMNLLGPNCLGFVNTKCNLNATFGEPVKELGNLHFISQSGAIATGIFDWCNSINMGFSDFVTLGNKAVLNESDFLNYFYNCSQNILYNKSIKGLSSVNPIGMYLESISNGKEFLRIAETISKKDPIFILKPGKTSAALQAMHSHTGAIAGEDSVLDAALAQTGVIRCQTLEDFFDLAKAFSWEDAPQGSKVAVISNAGGPGVLSADAVAIAGLEFAQFDDSTKKELLNVLPRSASILNPVDVLGDALADRYIKAAEIILKLNQVNTLLFILTPQIMTQIEKTALGIVSLSEKYKKPIFCAFIGGNLISQGEKILNKYKIPSFRFPERAVYVISKMWEFKKRVMAQEINKNPETVILLDQSMDGVRGVIQKAINEGYATLDNIDANKVIASAGISAPPTCLVSTLDEAKLFAGKNGWPVVLKLSSPGLIHKKEIGGVIIDIMNADQLDDAMHKMERKISQLNPDIKKNVKIQIQKGIQSGIQVIVGIKDDPTFGYVLLFGAGGSYAELIADKNLHLLPIELSQAKKLVENSKIYELLKDFQGEPQYALDKLYELIVRISKLALVIPEALEVEINPVIVTLNDVWAVDSKVIMRKNKSKPLVISKMLVATTLSNELLASQFRHYKFESEKPLIFESGQYISVKVAKNAIRAYSIATRQGSSNFDLLVDTRPGGPGSKFFENLKPGDKITYLGPFGVFTFKKDDNADTLLFLATGSGLSAVRCMIDSALLENNYTKPMYLYFGLTSPSEVFWKDHFEELEKKFSNFKFQIAVSKPDNNWKGSVGFITELVKKDFPDASNCAAYLCGHRAMIADACDLLISRGCSKEKIYTERFV